MTRVLHPFQSTFLEQSNDGLNILWAPTGAGKTFALMKDAESSAQRVVLYLTATPELVDQVAEEIRIHQQERTAGVTRIARGKEYGSIRQSLEKNPKWLVATPGRLDAIL
ncbi:MAG: DEAD/DEAH box helicase family protein, partial [Gammaproteobacteria bacterium]|nr:DEAD/DEAH box helicase family protein [Gammaproteobacteria bacterium]